MTACADCFLYLHGQRWPCHGGDVIGRAGTVARDALREVEVISRRHLRLDHHDGQWSLVALPESRNETFLNGTPMTRGQAYPLTRLQSVRIDTFEFHLGVATGHPTQFDPASLLAAADPVADPAADPPSLEDLPVPAIETDQRLAVVAVNARARSLLGTTLIGRDLDQASADPVGLRTRLLMLDPGPAPAPLTAVMHTPHGDRHLELSITRFELGLLVLCRDVTATTRAGEQSTATTTQLAHQLAVLAELALAPAFAAGDLASAFTLLTHRAATALACERVTVWLAPEDQTAHPSHRLVLQAIFDHRGDPPTTAATDMAYCPRFFEPLTADAPCAETDTTSPVLALLQEIGFAAADTRSLLCVALREESGLHGVLAFERMVERPADWSSSDRHCACSLASHALLAVRTAERREALASLQDSRDRLTAELAEANQYIQRILPEPITTGPITAEWHLQPSEALGGDSFGYHWVGDLFVMYVLDVVGHGTGMALLSISILNNVRARLLLGEAAMADPAGVLGALNAAFPMENQNNMLFSMWYGVFDRRSRQLTYASAGHPPALLLHGNAPADPALPDFAALGTEGPSVGALDGVVFTNASIAVSPGSKLFLFTDGAFEIPVTSDREWTFEEFTAVVRSTRFMPGGETTYLRNRIASLCAQPHFPDDFTVVRFSFEE